MPEGVTEGGDRGRARPQLALRNDTMGGSDDRRRRGDERGGYFSPSVGRMVEGMVESFFGGSYSRGAAGDDPSATSSGDRGAAGARQSFEMASSSAGAFAGAVANALQVCAT